MYSDIRIACWLSDKKAQKTNWLEMKSECNRHGLRIFKLNLQESIESQGPFSVLLHKLTDVIAAAQLGDIKSIEIISSIEQYIWKHPNVVVIDPIPNVQRLLNRYSCYSIIQSTDLKDIGVYVPNFCEITSDSVEKVAEQLEKSKVTYPFICKPKLGHGSKSAHQMTIIFNESDLVHCASPCVAQTFVNHNAILYKIFVIGKRHYYVRRPSLKNFHSNNMDAIFFDSGDVSKAGSQSKLSVLDPMDLGNVQYEPDEGVFRKIAETLRESFGMDLLGVDVVIDNLTQKYAIIDVNAYPGYDGFPNVYEALVECIRERIYSKTATGTI